MDLVFTDLDGTLLDHTTYAWDVAAPALDRLKQRGIPWILVTSKTRAEVEFWRGQLGNEHPFIVENGGAAIAPPAYRDFPELLEWGTPYAQLTADLRRAAQMSGCRVRGFHQMTAEEVAECCQMTLPQALLSKERAYDEPFVMLDPERAAAMTGAIEALGRRWTRGGRFWHIMGANDKATAVEALIRLFERSAGPVRSIGLGDGLNDAPFLKVVTVPVIIRSPHAAEVQAAVPRGVVTALPGPAGWNQAVLEFVAG